MYKDYICIYIVSSLQLFDVLILFNSFVANRPVIKYLLLIHILFFKYFIELAKS